MKFWRKKKSILYQELLVRIDRRYWIDLTTLLKSLRRFKYAAFKHDRPYIPASFPRRYPIGKDLDILVSKNVFVEFTQAIEEQAKTEERYSIRTVGRKDGVFVRIEFKNWLHYGFDLHHRITGLKSGFVDRALSRRLEYKGLYVLSEEDNCVLKILDHFSNSSKQMEEGYIKEKITNDMMEAFEEDEIRQKICEIIED